MGKQIQFYMVNEDENDFVEFLRSTGDIVFLPEVSKSSDSETFTSFVALKGRKYGEDCHIWNRLVSPAPAIKYVPQQDYYWLDFLKSEVVSVDRCRMVDNRLCAGRLYVENTVFAPDGTIVKKGDEFLKWYEKLCRWIRKTHRGRYRGACLSDRAEALAKSGIELL